MLDSLRWPLVALATVALAVGCAQTQNSKVDSRYELLMTVENFHRDMRWEEFEAAATVIDPSYRNVFLGRYQEDEDIDIVDLEIKAIDRQSTDRKLVEVEQKWLVEPDMTVKQKRFVEVWRRTDSGWFLRDRMRKTEWKRRHQEGVSEESEGDASARR